MEPSADQPSTDSTDDGLPEVQTGSKPGTVQTPRSPGPPSTIRRPSGLMSAQDAAAGNGSSFRAPLETSSSTKRSSSVQPNQAPSGDRTVVTNAAPVIASPRRRDEPGTSQTFRSF